MHLSVVIPTYNEKDNLQTLLSRVFSVFDKNSVKGEVIIVDDNSPDGTGALAEKLRKKYKRLKVLHRKSKLGLSSAVLDGFKASEGDVLGVMDADLSHPPETIPKMLEEIKKGVDFVIGSRYVDGGEIGGWGPCRKTVSKGANFLAKIITKVKDPMSGFFLIKRGCIEGVEFNPRGFKICLEFIAKAKYSKITEVPITFINRREGKSKAGLKEYYNFLVHLLSLISYKRSNHSKLYA